MKFYRDDEKGKECTYIDLTREFEDLIQSLFSFKMDIPLLRHGKRQRIETLIMKLYF